MISIAGNLVAPVQRKKALVSGSVFVNREEWIRSLRCAPSEDRHQKGRGARHLDTAPELPFGGDDDVPIKRISMRLDFRLPPPGDH